MGFENGQIFKNIPSAKIDLDIKAVQHIVYTRNIIADTIDGKLNFQLENATLFQVEIFTQA